MNIASHLSELSLETPDRKALIYPGGSLTYRELENLSNYCAIGLQDYGLGIGDRSVLMVKPGPEFLILCFGLIKLGAVPVLVDPGMGWKNLGKCLASALPVAFIGTPLAHVARILFGWARGTLRLKVTVGGLRFWSGISYRNLTEQGTASSLPFTSTLESAAAIVFTTGSTGVPKGVVYTHEMFNAQFKLLRDQFGITPGEVSLATFPLFALFDPALRVTTVFPRMDFTRPGRVDPEEILGPIQKYSCTHMFGSPALLDVVGRYAEGTPTRLPTLKRVLSAGAPVSAKTLRRFSKLLLGDADIHTPYGATEALPVCSISAREVLGDNGTAEGKGVCVGRPVTGVRVAIIGITEDPISRWSDELTLPAGEIGEIVVWGQNVSREYFELPQANERAKILSEEGVVGHRMGDLGYLDESGRLWFCGRKSHRVRTKSGTLFTVPCEGVFNQHAAVYRSALIGLGEPPDQEPVLCVELEQGYRKGSALADEILALGSSLPQTQAISRLLFHPSFPVDIRHNAKIFREKLAIWAARRTG
jgi:acyl-CoA synthetase (AMP-forming)/AMP-acid ligase II